MHVQRALRLHSRSQSKITDMHPVAGYEDLHLRILVKQGKESAQRVVDGLRRTAWGLCMNADKWLQVQPGSVQGSGTGKT